MTNVRGQDYVQFRTVDGIIFATYGFYHFPNAIRAVPIYKPDETGNSSKFLNLKYIKMFDIFGDRWLDKIKPTYIIKNDVHNILIPIKDIVEYFDPFSLPEEIKKLIRKTKWQKFINTIENFGVDSSDIGYFGSYLMGLQREHSDLDVVIKGVDNMQLLRKKLDEVPLVSELHITEALDRYEKIGYNFSRNDFPKMIAQRWAVIKKGNDSLKLHFTYRNSEIPTNPLPKKLNHEIILEGKVVNDVGTCFMPRRFTLETNKGIYTVLTYFWQFYHAVKTGDFVRIYGVQNAENSKIVVLRDRRIHGLQFIK